MTFVRFVGSVDLAYTISQSTLDTLVWKERSSGKIQFKISNRGRMTHEKSSGRARGKSSCLLFHHDIQIALVFDVLI